MYKSKEEIISENSQAAKLLSEKKFLAAEEILKPLIETFEESSEPSFLEVVTLNNIALLYQKTNDSYVSISYLSRALLFTPSSPSEFLYMIGTYINLCSINSSLGFHEEALQNGYKALEISDSINSIEIKGIITYNIACQLKLMQNYDKASQYFRDTISYTQSHKGINHKLNILASKAAALYSQPPKFHFRINSSGVHTSKNSSFSSNTQNKVTRYTMPGADISSFNLDPKVKINFSTKIASIPSTGRAFTGKILYVGMPYIKEIRTSKRIDASLYSTPKTKKKKFESRSSGKNTSINISNNSITDEFAPNFKNRLKNIKENISFLENKLKEFIERSRNIMAILKMNSVDYSSETHKAAKYIQNWYRKYVKKNKILVNE